MSSQALSSLLKDQVHGPTTAPITVSVSIDCLSSRLAVAGHPRVSLTTMVS